MNVHNFIRENYPDVAHDTILSGYTGSISHNTHDPNPYSIDDIDAMMIVVPPIKYYLGLSQYGSRGTRVIKDGRYDVVVYEVRKFISLLAQGNPNVLCMLWLRPEHYIDQTEAGNLIIKNRHLFVGKHVYNSFIGYGKSQLYRMTHSNLSRYEELEDVVTEMRGRGLGVKELPYVSGKKNDFMSGFSDVELINQYKSLTDGRSPAYMGKKRKELVEKFGYDVKAASHLRRLLLMGIEFLRDGELHVFRSDAQELRDIKAGKWSLEQVKDEADRLFAEAKVALAESVLPEKPDMEKVNELCVNVVKMVHYH